MLDPNSPPPLGADAHPQPYPMPPGVATPSLKAILHDRIEREGDLSFAAFMAEALYHPQHGYYAKAPKIGRAGDFFTSVSVGPLFGELLARHFLNWWHEAGKPQRWRLIETGAHDGTLAADLLHALKSLDPAAWNSVEYGIVEPLPRLRTLQKQTLEAHLARIRWSDSPEDWARHPLPGIAFGNELLDALPFHLVERSEKGDWLECRVTNSGDGFVLRNHPLSEPGLSEALQRIEAASGPFPAGYRTEIRLGLETFLQPYTRALASGRMLWIDYGFARPDYYHPSRTRGTLRTFQDHRAGEEPWKHPGWADITAHVDFTSFAEVAESLGMRVVSFQPQGTWLTRVASDWIASQESQPDARRVRQFQTLTHPAQLGGRFHILECTWNDGTAVLPESDRHRLALRSCPMRAER